MLVRHNIDYFEKKHAQLLRTKRRFLL